MTIVLVTGMSGSGKSTVLLELKRRGYSVVETDSPGWCIPRDGDLLTPESEWIWDEQAVSQLLDQFSDRHLFIGGCRENQNRFYNRIDFVVLLTAPIDVLMHRVATRSSNPYGATAEDRMQITHDKIEFEPLLRRGADVVIDTANASSEAVANRLEELLKGRESIQAHVTGNYDSR